MSKKVAIIQSNYIPWKGYFDIINDVDLFIFYDDVQYTKRDWRNRNRIKTPHGQQWLSVPVGTNTEKLIHEVTIDDKSWARKHYSSLILNYSKAPYLKNYKEFLEYVYLENVWGNLSRLNQYLIKEIATRFLGVRTRFDTSMNYNGTGQKLERIISLLKNSDATTYISGPAARDYLDNDYFGNENIELIYKDYSGYPEYPQSHPPFDHYVTIFDLLFHTGPDAPYYIWGWRQD